MDIFPIWRTVYWESEEDSVRFRIVSAGETACEGTASKYPDEDTLKVNLNKPCQAYLDSVIDFSATGDTASNAYREFALQVKSNNQWITTYEFAFVNDWSYVDHAGDGYSEPINGHSSAGQILVYSCLNETTAETICYDEYDWNPYISIIPSAVSFSNTGGTATLTIFSNCNWSMYQYGNLVSLSQTTGESGTTTITLTCGENSRFAVLNDTLRFRASKNGVTATEYAYISQAAATPYLNVTSGDGAAFDGHRAQWVLTYDTNVPRAYYVLSNGQTGYTSGGRVVITLPGSLTGETYTISFYAEPGGTLLDTATATQAGTGEYFTILSGNGRRFGTEGGVWTITYDTNIPNVYYEFSGGQTGYTSSGTLSLNIPRSSTQMNHYVNFYNGEMAYAATAYASQTNLDAEYLTITPEENGYLYVGLSTSGGSTHQYHLQVSQDGGEHWTDYGMTSSSVVSIPATAGVEILMKATFDVNSVKRCPKFLLKNNNDYSVRYSVKGNLASLFTEDLTGYTYIPDYVWYSSMFSGNTNLLSVDGLVIPEYSPYEKHFYRMFYGCTSIKYPPIMETIYPAGSASIMEEMFAGCTSLTETPVVELDSSGHSTGNAAMRRMFDGCTSLTKTSISINVDTASQNAFFEMYRGCTSLVNAQPMNVVLMKYRSCYGMYSGCTSLTNVPDLPDCGLYEECYRSMFEGCVSLVNAPVISYVGQNMDCYYDTMCFAFMFAGCTSLVTAPALHSETLADYCYRSMFEGCVSLVNAPALAPFINVCCINHILTGTYYRMFADCISLQTAPELLSEATTPSSYYQMFYGCTSLNHIKCLATNISSTNSTTEWLADVAPSGTFVKAAAMEGWTAGDDGIPVGWTIVNA